MNEFIEKNRGLLRFYCITAQITGLLLLIVPGIGIAVEIISGSTPNGHRFYIPYMIQAVVLNFMFLGLVALGVAQFIRYVFERHGEPGLILRFGDKVLYIYAGLVILGSVVQYLFQITVVKGATFPMLLVYFAASLLPATAKALILVGLGTILHRVMPVIEESKTLV